MPNYINGEAPPLEGQGYLRFVIGGDAQGLFLRDIERVSKESRVPGTTGSHDSIIYLHELLNRIADTLHNRRSESGGGYFKREDLEIVRGVDSNVSGFVTAILINIGFVEAVNPDLPVSDGKYRFRQGKRKCPPWAGMAPATRGNTNRERGRGAG